MRPWATTLYHSPPVLETGDWAKAPTGTSLVDHKSHLDTKLPWTLQSREACCNTEKCFRKPALEHVSTLISTLLTTHLLEYFKWKCKVFIICESPFFCSTVQNSSPSEGPPVRSLPWPPFLNFKLHLNTSEMIPLSLSWAQEKKNKQGKVFSHPSNYEIGCFGCCSLLCFQSKSSRLRSYTSRRVYLTDTICCSCAQGKKLVSSVSTGNHTKTNTEKTGWCF